MGPRTRAATRSRQTRFIIATLGAAALSLVVVRAQQAPAPAARPMVPVAASSIAGYPETYYGENVSVMAAVETLLSKTAFTIDQDKTKSTGRDVLVLAPTLNGVLVPNSYVTVVGEVIKFDPAEVAKRLKSYTIDLPAELVTKFQGRPAILATAVINSALLDVAKRVLPPLTPAEAAFDKVMKQVGPTFNNLRAGLESPDAAALKDQVATLKKSFTEAEAFFKSRGTADATGWAAEALKLVASMETAAAAGKFEDVKAPVTSLTTLCQNCHNAYRERLEDGTFRIKGDVR